jgi:hypothetical protein
VDGPCSTNSNKENKMKKLLGLVFGLGLAVAANAANVTWTGSTDEDFSTAGNWSDSNIPNAADNVWMAGGGTGITTIDDTRTLNSIHVRDGHTFNIDITAGTLNSDFAFRIGEDSTIDGSTVNLTDGAVTVATDFSMSSGSANGTSFFTATGGSLTAASMTVGTGAAATFSLVGDDATVDVSGALTAGAYSAFSFTFDETGVSTINSATLTIDTAATLTVDGTSYTGGAADFVLFDATTTGSFTDVSVTGFGVLDTDYTLTQDATGITLTVIPEPATIGLLGLGTVALLAIRRQTV